MRGFSVSPYSITFITAFLVSFSVVFVLLKKRGVPVNYIGYSMLLNIVLILYGAKMFSVVSSGFQTDIWKAGFSSLGGAIGLLVGIAVFGRIYKEGRRALWESYVVVLPLLYGISKFGCHLVGCCHGIPYTGVLAVSYDNPYMQGGPYFPIQLLESIGFLAVFAVALFCYLGTTRDYLVPVVMILCAITKFSLDYLREEHIGKLISVNQAVCIGFVVWGMVSVYKKNKNVKKVKMSA